MAVRVLHLVHWLNRGGLEVWLRSLVRHVDRAQVAMDVCCKGPSVGILADDFRASGAQVHHLPLGWTHLPFGRRLAGLLRQGRYDILHVHTGIASGYPCRVAAGAGFGVVTTFYSTVFDEERNTAGGRPDTGVPAALRRRLRSWYGRWSIGAACRWSHAVVAVSEAVLDAVRGVAGGIDAGKCMVLPCGTIKSPSLDPEVRRRTRRELGIEEAMPVVIHLGTMREAKNHVGLIRIAERMRQAGAEFRLLIVSGGPLRPLVEQEIAKRNLGDVVRLLGGPANIDGLLEAADLLLFPSKWEGLPVAVAEAQMFGLPVVGSDIAPMREATVPGETALLFPVDAEDQMAEAAVGLLRDEPRRRAMASAAMRFARERFSLPDIAGRYVELYRRCMAARHGN